MTPEQIYDFAKYVRKEERDRILALLQSGEGCGEHTHVVGGKCKCELVALINGDNK